VLHATQLIGHAARLLYLEWLKYKTAKPPLYTVYTTRNRNQLNWK